MHSVHEVYDDVHMYGNAGSMVTGAYVSQSWAVVIRLAVCWPLMALHGISTCHITTPALKVTLLKSYINYYYFYTNLTASNAGTRKVKPVCI